MTHDPVRWFWAGLAVVLWLLVIVLVRWSQVRARRVAAARAAALAPGAQDAPALVVAFASQTGLAEELAWMTARSLSDAGVPARVALLGDLELAELRVAGRLLIVASTTGEGDAPDAVSRSSPTISTSP